MTIKILDEEIVKL